MPRAPRLLDDAAECVDAVIKRLDGRIVLALPIGIGKPNPLANEFYRRAQRDPRISLKIYTALSLRTPQWHGELDRRLVQPLVQRVFGNFVELDYVRDLHRNSLPPNVEIIEFFLEPGAFLNAPHSQRHFVSTNYSHVARDLVSAGVNVVAQLIAKSGNGRAQYSLGSNPDITVDLLNAVAQRGTSAPDFVMIGEVNRQMPFMFGAAAVEADVFDYIVEHPRYEFDLFAPPNLKISTADYAIGLNAAALVRDGGTLQIGIGELGAAITYCLQLRQQQNGEFREILGNLGLAGRFAAIFADLGGEGKFDEGLYGCSEMLVDGFIDLYRSGVLKRRVYDDLRIQRLLHDRAITERVDETMLSALASSGLSGELSETAFRDLQRIGVFRRDCGYAGGSIETAEGASVPARLDDAHARSEMLRHCTGRQLTGGVLLHGGFFLGPRGFYAALRDMPEIERRQFSMSGISFINELHGDEALKVAQRRDSRFINATMMVSMLGATTADGLDDGRVVSGVGGQYDFVAMAHALPGARSITAVRSTRTKDGQTRSNIVWNYGHTTIPRHLRDIVVTEYGVADLRGKSDRDVIAALLNVADSRFQESLLRAAVGSGKLPAGHAIPDAHRNNFPQAQEQKFTLARARGLFSDFPFGTDLTQEEIDIAAALLRIRDKTRGTWARLKSIAAALVDWRVPSPVGPALARMNLERPQSWEERVWQRLLVRELMSHDRPRRGPA